MAEPMLTKEHVPELLRDGAARLQNVIFAINSHLNMNGSCTHKSILTETRAIVHRALDNIQQARTIL